MWLIKQAPGSKGIKPKRADTHDSGVDEWGGFSTIIKAQLIFLPIAFSDWPIHSIKSLIQEKWQEAGRPEHALLLFRDGPLGPRPPSWCSSMSWLRAPSQEGLCPTSCWAMQQMLGAGSFCFSNEIKLLCSFMCKEL